MLLVVIVGILIIAYGLIHFMDYRFLIVALVILTIICVLSWLAYIPIWNVSSGRYGKIIKINTYDKLHGLEY